MTGGDLRRALAGLTPRERTDLITNLTDLAAQSLTRPRITAVWHHLLTEAREIERLSRARTARTTTSTKAQV